jgi:Sec-independent protein secretion pathway component TatC
MASFTFSAIVTPPDPFSQLRINGMLLPVVLVGSYVLAYRVGVEWI